jgi:hypothetical protein
MTSVKQFATTKEAQAWIHLIKRNGLSATASLMSWSWISQLRPLNETGLQLYGE